MNIDDYLLDGRPLSERERAIVARVKDQFLSLVRGDSMEEFIDDRAGFIDKLKENFPGCQEYLMYHVLLGSSLLRTAKHFDFPEHHSVAAFFQERYDRYTEVHV